MWAVESQVAPISCAVEAQNAPSDDDLAFDRKQIRKIPHVNRGEDQLTADNLPPATELGTRSKTQIEPPATEIARSAEAD
jgi:hypothetical protein